MEILEYALPLERDNKKTPSCISYIKFFLKYGPQDNHWVGHLVMKPVDAAEIQKIREMREGKNDQSENSEMGIINEGALDIAQTLPK